MKYKVPIGIDMQMRPTCNRHEAEKGGDALALVHSLLCIPMNYEDEADI